MTSPFGDDYVQPRELLAAYADADLEGHPALANLRARVEAWLMEHPEGQAELAEHRRLRRLWQATTPPRPAPDTWATLWERISTTPIEAARPARVAHRPTWAYLGLGAAA